MLYAAAKSCEVRVRAGLGVHWRGVKATGSASSLAAFPFIARPPITALVSYPQPQLAVFVSKAGLFSRAGRAEGKARVLEAEHAKHRGGCREAANAGTQVFLLTKRAKDAFLS